MKQVKSPGAFLKWKGQLVEVISIGKGKTIYMRPIGVKPCLNCGHTLEYDALEDSPLFQGNAEPIETIT